MNEVGLTKILGLKKYPSTRRLITFRKNLIVMTKFPDIGQMAKIPWHFFKIPWQFPDLENFFPDFFPDMCQPCKKLTELKHLIQRCSFVAFWTNLFHSVLPVCAVFAGFAKDFSMTVSIKPSSALVLLISLSSDSLSTIWHKSMKPWTLNLYLPLTTRKKKKEHFIAE